MGTPYLGELRIISFNFAMKGWAFTNGQLLQINQNQALFSLLGTTYGGNGQTTFALPNLQGRAPLHVGSGGGATYTLGQAGGEAAHTLSVSEMPAHTHTALVSASGGVRAPSSTVLPGAVAEPMYDPLASPTTTMASPVLGATGGSAAHENQMPYLVLNFVIALQGIFPSPP